MALQLLGVLLLGGLAAAADDASIVWWSGSRLALPCVVPGAQRLQPPRRPPLPIDDDQPRRRNYFWSRDGEDVNAKRISQNGSLEIPRRRGGGEGLYQCSARHGGGLVLGYPVKLQYAYIEKQFTQHPENRTARAGQPVTFSCSISSAPEASLSWLKDGVGLPDDPRFNILPNQLLITDVRQADAGLYRCIASNVHANKTRASHRGRLEVVEGLEDLEPAWLPVVEERNLTVARGAKAVLPCPVTAWPRPEIIWELTPPGGRTGELDTTDQVLVLPRVELDQEGVYTCKVAGRNDLVQTFNLTISEPVVIAAPPTSREALRASTVRLSCSATGRPEPALTWYKDGQPLPLVGRRKLLKSKIDDKIELVISSVTTDDAGVYQCFASNAISTASEWASLSVSGSGAPAPVGVACAPITAFTVELRWSHEEPDTVLAYTVHVADQDREGGSFPGLPHTNTEEVVRLEQPLTPYRFQVRAYIKTVASDMSETVECQGQGVPIRLRKLPNDTVSVSWSQFAQETPGVAQWMVQYKEEDGAEQNVTLPGSVVNYTLNASPDHPLLVRVLGSRTDEWLQQNLTLVAWSSTSRAGEDQDNGDLTIVTDLELLSSSAHTASLYWRCADESAQTVSFIVCARRSGSQEDKCQESLKSSTTLEGLEPDTEYEVRVQARIAGRALGGPFSAPFVVHTLPAESDRFKDLSYEFINSTTVRVTWGGAASACTVQHTAQLKLPVEVWRTVQVVGNEVLISGIDPSEETYVMVTDAQTLENSRVLTVPRQQTPDDGQSNDIKDIKFVHTAAGVKVSWSGAGKSYKVRYAQDIAAPLDQWPEVNVTGPEVTLSSLDVTKKTYVMVMSLSGDKKNQVLTIPPAPEDRSSLYIIVGAVCGAALLLALGGAALCVWRRRKRNRSPLSVPVAGRSRRRRAASDGDEEEGAELKDVGGRLANGGAGRGAGEPLLNGHVHITENPTVPKTPNGKRKNLNYEAAFDVSRYDADTTASTTLDDTLGGDRGDPGDLGDPGDPGDPGDDSARLDDNMNTRAKVRARQDHSTPTLQPNG